MAEAEPTTEPGGFLTNSLPSPAPSNFSSSPAPSSLPHPRARPLKAGSAKEDAARRFVEGRLMQISRRYVKKFEPPEPGDVVIGYVNMVDVCKDLSEVVDVLWLSGTPSLQIPYLLNIALAVTTYISAFPPAPVATFELLRKLDHAFASLLKGEDSATGEVLPGFGSTREGGMSRTDMVRCKSLVESTRVLVVEVMRDAPGIERNGRYGTDVETNDDDDMDLDGQSTGAGESTWDPDADEDGHSMDVARVYARTIVELGVLIPNDIVYDATS